MQDQDLLTKLRSLSIWTEPEPKQTYATHATISFYLVSRLCRARNYTFEFSIYAPKIVLINLSTHKIEFSRQKYTVNQLNIWIFAPKIQLRILPKIF